MGNAKWLAVFVACRLDCVSETPRQCSLKSSFPQDSLVLHVNVAEGAIEDSIDEVCEGEVEDQHIGDGSHPLMAWKEKMRRTKQFISYKN